jgi:hypothetical protein
MAIFPTFMLAPSIVAEGSEQFVREAMQNAIGLPPIIYQYPLGGCEELSVQPKKHTPTMKKRERQKDAQLRKQHPPTRKDSDITPQKALPELESSSDFPLLGGNPVGICSSVDTPRVKFRSLKKKVDRPS